MEALEGWGLNEFEKSAVSFDSVLRIDIITILLSP